MLRVVAGARERANAALRSAVPDRARDLLRGVALRVRAADITTLAAAVAYNVFLAIVPLAFALLGVAAFIGQSEEALGRVEATLEVFAPEAVTDFVTDLLVDAEVRVGGQQGLLIVVSILLALVLGSRAVVALQKALAAVEHRTERRPPVAMRLVAVALTIGGGAALLITSFLLVFGREVMEFLAELTSVAALEGLGRGCAFRSPQSGCSGSCSPSIAGARRSPSPDRGWPQWWPAPEPCWPASDSASIWRWPPISGPPSERSERSRWRWCGCTWARS